MDKLNDSELMVEKFLEFIKDNKLDGGVLNSVDFKITIKKDRYGFYETKCEQKEVRS